MSRAFVKEPDGEPLEDQPNLPQSPHPNYVTAGGLRQLRERLARLHAQLHELQAGGDDLANRLPVSQLEREIRWLAARIDRAIVVAPPDQSPQKVCFGTLVRARDPQGELREFGIVGEDEADAEQGRLSWVSPLPQAALGAEVGEVITWKRPAGDLELEIVSIEYLHT
jgi:transcription elongation factor GreB